MLICSLSVFMAVESFSFYCYIIENDCFFFAQRYFPASGYRPGGTASCDNTGSNSYGWDSSTYGLGSYCEYGSCLSVSDTWLYLLSGGGRACGFSVRCVQAFIKLFRSLTFFNFRLEQILNIVK